MQSFNIQRSYGFQRFLKLLLLTAVCIATSSAKNLLAEESSSAALSHLKLQLIAEDSSYHPGQSFWVAIRAQPEEGWHIYWKYPGDSGTSLKTDWSSSFGANITGPEFPIPKRIAVGPLVNFGYDSETLFLFEVNPETTQNVPVQLRVDTEWLVCKEECIPVNTVLALSVPSSSASEVSKNTTVENWSEKIEQTRQLLPINYPSVDLRAHESASKIILDGKLPSDKQGTQLTFFPLVSLTIQNAAPQLQHSDNGMFSLELLRHKDSKATQIQGILVSSKGWTPGSKSAQAIHVSVPIDKTPMSRNGQNSSLLIILLFAFAGGLILNLMPCVFPILTLKIFSLVSKKRLQEQTLHRHSISFTLGVVFTFLALALFIVVARAGGEAIGWGFQLQSPGFVACLALLTFIVSLNFLGVFEFGNSLQTLSGKLDSKHSHTNDNIRYFLDGVLMTTLATPCTAPFMGSAMAYGLGAPIIELLAVFTSLAVGMATPFVLLSYSSTLRSFLPKPGAWMDTLKRILAFPLFATTIWLLWVLGLQTGVNLLSIELCVLLLTSFFLWLYGEYTGPTASRKQRVLMTIITFIALGFAFVKSASLSNEMANFDAIKWEPFSRERIAELKKEKKIIYVDFTAAWCITCQVNKLVAFSSREVADKVSELNVAMLEADWTNKDKEITQALAEFGRDGVPLNVIYSSNEGTTPQILPQVLTPGIVLAALDKANIK